MPTRIKQKWRPPLTLVIGGALAAVLAAPIIAIGYFKVAGFILGWGETTLMIVVIALVLTALLGFLLWRLVLRPVWALTAHAIAIKEGRGDAPLPEHFGTPELTSLAQAVDEMGSTLMDREAGLRAYTNHVTHELKSPLTSLIGAAELLEADTPQKDRVQLIETIRVSSRKMQDQLEALRRLASAREPVGRGPSTLSNVVPRIETGLPLLLQGDMALPIDEDALIAVLTHLAQNAAAHGATRLSLGPDGDDLRISDDGPGIAPGNRTRVFEPFFTTRRESGGTGMGLAIVRSMLRAAGGDIRLVPSDTGAVFDITF